MSIQLLRRTRRLLHRSLRRGHVVRWSFARGDAPDDADGGDPPAPPPPGAAS